MVHIFQIYNDNLCVCRGFAAMYEAVAYRKIPEAGVFVANFFIMSSEK